MGGKSCATPNSCSSFLLLLSQALETRARAFAPLLQLVDQHLTGVLPELRERRPVLGIGATRNDLDASRAFTDVSLDAKDTIARFTVWQLMSVFVPSIASQRTRFCGVSRNMSVVVPEPTRQPASFNARINADSSAAGVP